VTPDDHAPKAATDEWRHPNLWGFALIFFLCPLLMLALAVWFCGRIGGAW
jgi:hypothetical protein